MLTFEKVLDVFADYLAEDSDCEVLNTSHGHLVMYWESCHNSWVTTRLALTPEELRDVLRERYVDYHSYQFTCDHKRDPDSNDKRRIERMGDELAAQCEKN